MRGAFSYKNTRSDGSFLVATVQSSHKSQNRALTLCVRVIRRFEDRLALCSGDIIPFLRALLCEFLPCLLLVLSFSGFTSLAFRLLLITLTLPVPLQLFFRRQLARLPSAVRGAFLAGCTPASTIGSRT